MRLEGFIGITRLRKRTLTFPVAHRPEHIVSACPFIVNPVMTPLLRPYDCHWASIKVRGSACIYDRELYMLSDKKLGFDLCWGGNAKKEAAQGGLHGNLQNVRNRRTTERHRAGGWGCDSNPHQKDNNKSSPSLYACNILRWGANLLLVRASMAA